MIPHADSPSGEPHAGQTPRCGAHGRQKNRPCRHVAGFRTDHPGIGKCFLHGGQTTIKHGRYSGVVRAIVKGKHGDLYDKIRTENEREQESLFDEIALLRTILAVLPDVLPGKTPLDTQQQMAAALQLVEAIGKAVLRNAQIGHAMGQRFTTEELMELGDRILLVLARNVGDSKVIQQIIDELRLIGHPLTELQVSATSTVPMLPG